MPSTASRSLTWTRRPVDGEDPDAVQADRVGPVGRAGAEDALLRPGQVAARMHPQDVTPSAIQPREDQDVVADANAVEGLEHGRLEDEPGVGRALVALVWRRRDVGQRRLDRADRRDRRR